MDKQKSVRLVKKWKEFREINLKTWNGINCKYLN